MHTESHPMRGQEAVVILANHPQITVGPHVFRIEDWWDKLTGGSWMDAKGNPAALVYALRIGLSGLPLDNEVIYGHIGAHGHLAHVSEFA
jgi:hypothetical protein